MDQGASGQSPVTDGERVAGVMLANVVAMFVVTISASYIWGIRWGSPIIDAIAIGTAILLVCGEMVWLCLCWPRRERD